MVFLRSTHCLTKTKERRIRFKSHTGKKGEMQNAPLFSREKSSSRSSREVLNDDRDEESKDDDGSEQVVEDHEAVCSRDRGESGDGKGSRGREC